MPESVEGFGELQKLRREVQDLKAISAALLHAQPDLATRILDLLRKDEVLSRILLLVDGGRSQNEILAQLQAEKVRGSSKGNVSVKFDRLSKDLGLIAFDRRTKAGSIYRKTVLDDALKVSRTLERERTK